MTIYADSSFFVSCYLPDAHSHEADRRVVNSPDIFMSPFNRSELSVAIFRQVFLKRVSPAIANQAFTSFEEDCRAGIWTLIPFPSSAWEANVGLAKRFCPALGSRALDMIHVASALELKAERFWTFDERQARLAEAAGLDTRA